MTPTASSSSILLLNPAAPTGAGIATTDAQATPDAGLGGFELLLGAMQQLQQELSATVLDDGSTSDPTASDGEQGGNGLPQLGMLLPSVLPVSGKVAEGSGDILPTDSDTDKKDFKSPEGDESGADFLLFRAMQSTPVLVNNNTPSSSSASSGVNVAQSAVSDIVALSTSDELASQIAATTATATTKDNGNSKADRNGAVSLKLGSELSRTSLVDSPQTKLDTSGLAQGIPDVATTVESDFDILVKHFEAPASTQVAPASTGLSDSSAVNHASRTYSNAMNSNAAVNVPVGGDGWGDAVADKVMWFSANKISSAEIHLNPPDLGPLQVRVSTQSDQASVVFTSQHAAVRDALDQALPRLRDMLGNQGMQLLDVSVGGQTPQQQQQQFARNDSPQNGSQFAGVMGDDTAETKTSNVTNINTARLLRSGFDAYA